MSLSTEHPDEPLDCSLPQYAFCRGEKQLLRICMHSATSAGAALALQGCATGLLGAPPGAAGAPAAAPSLPRLTQRLLPRSAIGEHARLAGAGWAAWGGAAAALGHTLRVARAQKGAMYTMHRPPHQVWALAESAARCVQRWLICARTIPARPFRRPSTRRTSWWRPRLSPAPRTASTASSSSVRPRLTLWTALRN